MTLVTPAPARTVSIESMVPLAGHSKATLDWALEQAIANVVRRATARGLSSAWIDGLWVLPDAVVLWMIATDDNPNNDPDDDNEGPDGDAEALP